MHSFRPVHRFLAFSCIVGFLALPFALAKKQDQPAAQNFLPPVALINSSLTIEELEGKTASDENENTLGPVVFSAVSPATVKLSDKPAALQNTLQINTSNEHDMLLGFQQKVDERDLKSLWDATVEKNPVIRFSLEKLALPIDLQAKHSSKFLNKTLAAMLNGAAMGAMLAMPGAGAYQNMGLATASQAAQNVILGNNKAPQTSGLTATEQIQLAGLVDDLKADLIQNYQSYKKTLEQLAEARATSLKNNNLYATALKSPNPLARMAAASNYYKAMINETDIKQRALVYRLKLERMAGKEAVNNLQLALIVTPQAAEVAGPMPPDSPAKPVATTKTSATVSKTTDSSLQAIDMLPTAPLGAIHPIAKNDNATIGPSLSVLPSSQETVGPEMPIDENATPVKTSAYKPPAPLSPIAEPSFDSPPVPTIPNHFPFLRKGDY